MNASRHTREKKRVREKMTRDYMGAEDTCCRACFISRLLLCYGVATISTLLKITGLFCKRALQKRPIFSKEKDNFKEPTNRRHPIEGRQLLSLMCYEA